MKKLRICILIFLCVCAAAFCGTELLRQSRIDRTLPVIQCPDAPLILPVGENSSEKLLDGVTAWDDKDGDLTAQLMVEGVAKNIQGNETTLTYAVADSDHHVTKQTRTVRYTDYVPPRFSLSQELRYEVGQTVATKGRVTAWDVIDGDLSGQIKVTSVGLNAGIEGRYPVTFEVTNSMGDTSSLTAEIRIANRAAGEPRIHLSQYLVYLKRGGNFQPMDYFDYVQGANPENLSVSSDADLQTPGVYQVTYSCAGSSGAVGTTVLFAVVEE